MGSLPLCLSFMGTIPFAYVHDYINKSPQNKAHCFVMYSYSVLAAVIGENVTISNGAIQLMFNTTGHLVKWTSLNSGVVHTLEQQYVQEFEKAGLDELNVCDGTNVYTFVPDDGSTVLTPKVHTYNSIAFVLHSSCHFPPIAVHVY